MMGQTAFSSPQQSQWPLMNGAGDQSNGFAAYSNFPNKSQSMLMPNLHAGSGNESYPPPTGSKFKSFFSQDSSNSNSNISSPFGSNGLPNSAFNKPQQVFGPISRPMYPNTNFQNPMKSSLFPSDSIFSPAEQITGSFPRDNSLPLPIGYQRSQSLTSAFTSVNDAMWKENSQLLGPSQVPSVDNQVDQELAKAIEEELNTGTTTVSIVT